MRTSGRQSEVGMIPSRSKLSQYLENRYTCFKYIKMFMNNVFEIKTKQY